MATTSDRQRKPRDVPKYSCLKGVCLPPKLRNPFERSLLLVPSGTALGVARARGGGDGAVGCAPIDGGGIGRVARAVRRGVARAPIDRGGIRGIASAIRGRVARVPIDGGRIRGVACTVCAGGVLRGIALGIARASACRNRTAGCSQMRRIYRRSIDVRCRNIDVRRRDVDARRFNIECGSATRMRAGERRAYDNRTKTLRTHDPAHELSMAAHQRPEMS
jgi:hypothetical protein